METSVDTSVDSDATLPAIEGIIPGFVDHPNADTELEVNHRPDKNECACKIGKVKVVRNKQTSGL